MMTPRQGAGSVLFGPVRTYPHRSVSTMAAEFLALYADRPAVRQGDRILSYRDLDRLSAVLAERLVSRDAGAVVAVHLPRGIDFAVAVLGILRSGAAYLPLDQSYPAGRLRLMVEVAGVRTVVGEAGALNVAAEAVVRVPSAQEEDVADAGWRDEPDKPAYVLFTSGSTGTPKGVAMPHRALANLLQWHREPPLAISAPQTLQYTPLSFDVSFQEFFVTWTSGGTIHMIDEARRIDLDFLTQYCAHAGITNLFMPYAALSGFAEYAAYRGRKLPRLRQVFTAGEQPVISDGFLRFFEESVAGAMFVNQYGPTETHVATEYVFTGPPRSWPRVPPIGAPVANCGVALLDDSGRVVPLGAEGNLHIFGRPVALGYLGGSSADVSRFIDVARIEGVAGSATDVLAYVTGDRARVMNGQVMYLGRDDGQVKISGVRIELHEVEAAVVAMPQVSAAVACLLGSADRRRLAVFVVTEQGAALTAASIRNEVARVLPSAAVPSVVRLVDGFPTTSSGKVDRAALSATPIDTVEGPTELAPARTTVDRVAARLADAVGAATASPHDTIFDVGGGSLEGMRFAVGLAREFDLDVPITVILGGASVADIARAVDANEWPQSDASSVASGPRPASPYEEELWLAAQLLDPATFVVAVTLTSEVPLDVPRLGDAVRTVFRRHLGMTILDDTGELLVHDAPGTEPAVRIVTGASHEDHMAFVTQPFDLEAPGLCRVLIDTTGLRTRLVLAFHHLAVDDRSVAILLGELQDAYAGKALHPPATARRRERGVHDADRTFWRRYLAGASVDGSTDLLPRDGSRRGDLRHDHRTISAAARASLAQWSSRHAVTRYVTFLAALVQAAGKIARRSELMLVTPVNMREPHERDQVGYFVNLLPLRLRAQGDMPLEKLARSIQDEMLRVLRHRRLAFSEIVAPIARTGGIQTLFHLSEELPESVDLDGTTMSVDVALPTAMNFDLSVQVRPAAGVLEIRHDTGAYRASTVSTLLTGWCEVIVHQFT